MITLREGGALEFSPGAVVEIPYRIEGDQLILPGGSKDASESRQKIVWLANDKLRLDAESGLGIELTRAGARESASESILGEWHGKREMAGQQLSILYFFQREGDLFSSFLSSRRPAGTRPTRVTSISNGRTARFPKRSSRSMATS
jgi:hypothetical protein